MFAVALPVEPALYSESYTGFAKFPLCNQGITYTVKPLSSVSEGTAKINDECGKTIVEGKLYGECTGSRESE
jgi:hypothetical protein